MMDLLNCRLLSFAVELDSLPEMSYLAFQILTGYIGQSYLSDNRSVFKSNQFFSITTALPLF